MAEALPRWASETEVIRRLEAEWRVIADSWWLRRRLEVWAVEDPRLAFEDGHRLVAAAQRRDVSSWADRDRVLAALLDRFDDDPVAQRVALEPAGTPPSFRVYVNTRRRTLRAAIRERSEPLVLVDDFSQVEGEAGPGAPADDEERRLEQLVEWVRERGRLREETARLVVLTRGWCLGSRACRRSQRTGSDVAAAASPG